MPVKDASILNHAQIAGHTRTFGGDGYRELFVRDEPLDDDTVFMVTEWVPTAEQLKTLNNGGRIYLGFQADVGAAHPPVILATGTRDTVKEVENG